MTTSQTSPTYDQRLKNWSDDIAAINAGSKCLTIGLTSGNRNPNDARVVYRLVKSLTDSIGQQRGDSQGDSSLLLCRINVQLLPFGPLLTFSDEVVEQRIEKSALGAWDQVEVAVSVGNVASKSLQQVVRTLPKWKLRYKTIVIDLGAIHHLPSRIIGRWCDSTYVLIGPSTCASAQWITQFVEYHRDCGSHIAGTITASAAA